MPDDAARGLIDLSERRADGLVGIEEWAESLGRVLDQYMGNEAARDGAGERRPGACNRARGGPAPADEGNPHHREDEKHAVAGLDAALRVAEECDERVAAKRQDEQRGRRQALPGDGRGDSGQDDRGGEGETDEELVGTRRPQPRRREGEAGEAEDGTPRGHDRRVREIPLHRACIG